MIRPIDIRLNAAHPDYPLAEAVTFTGSPSTVLVRGVPPNCGRWAITAVSVAASYPDGSTTTRAAVQSANGVWVATLPATATSGRTANGLRVLADGIDENGEAVTGYVLGVADFAVASLDVTPAPQPGETSWQMLYFDAVPGVLRKGDVAKVDGVLKFYNGTAWEAFAAPPTLDDDVTRTSANGVKSSGIWSAIWGALTALPTGFSSLYDWCVTQLAGKANVDDFAGPNPAIVPFKASIAESAQYATSAVGAGGLVVNSSNIRSAQTIFDQIDGKLAKSGGSVAKIEWVNSGQSNATLLITFANGKTLAFDYDGYSSDTVATREWIAAQSFVNRLTSYFTAGNLVQLTQDGGIADSTIPAANVATKSEIPYDRITITTGQLQDHAEQKVTLNAATTTLSLPALTDLTGKVSDFGIDVVNGYEVSGTPTAASFSLAGTLGTDYNLIVPEGEDWSEMSALAAGEMAVYYFTLSAFAINDKPTWEVMKKVVELVPVPTAP